MACHLKIIDNNMAYKSFLLPIMLWCLQEDDGVAEKFVIEGGKTQEIAWLAVLDRQWMLGDHGAFR